MTIKDEWKQSNGKYQCPYCEKQYTKNGIGIHIWKSHGEGKNHKPYKGKDRKSLGLKHTEKTKEIISKKNKNNPNVTGRAKTFEAEIERRKKISQNGKGKIGGYRKGSGVGKSGWYKGYWCDSSWELAFVIYNLEHNIQFERNKKKFQYGFKGKKYKYIPDFLMEDRTYVEIKGYENEKTLAKYSAVDNLIVLKYNDLKYIIDYVISKYGENFIELYE